MASSLETTVKVKGLPFRASASDVKRFFNEAGGGLGNAIKEDGIRQVSPAVKPARSR